MASEDVRIEQFKAAMGSFAAGVTIITGIDAEGTPHALTATAFSSVSLAPPLCLVCLDRRARTCRAVRGRKTFAVNILNSDQGALSAHFASKVADKFAGIPFRSGAFTSCPLIEGALSWMECRVVDVHSGGDHDIVLGRVVSVQVQEGAPLVFFRGSYSSLPPPPSSRPPAADVATSAALATPPADLRGSVPDAF